MDMDYSGHESVGLFVFLFNVFGFCLPIFGILAFAWFLLTLDPAESRCLPGSWIFSENDNDNDSPGPWDPSAMIVSLEKQLTQSKNEKYELEGLMRHYFNLYEGLVTRNSALSNFISKATNGVFRGGDDEDIPEFDVALLVKSPTPANVHVPSSFVAEVQRTRKVLELREALAHAEAALLEQTQDKDAQITKLQADLNRLSEECVARDTQNQKLRAEVAKAASDTQRQTEKELVPRLEAKAVRSAADEAESLRKDSLITELQAEVARVTNEARELSSVRDLLQADLHRSAQECNSYGGQVHVLQAALNSAAQERQNVEHQVVALNADRHREAQLLNKVAGLKQENRQLRETVHTQNQNISQGNVGVLNLQQQHTALKTDHSSLKQLHSALETRHSSLRREHELLQQQHQHQQQFPLADVNDSAVRKFKKEVQDLKAELKEEEMSYLELQREVEYKIKVADTERRMLESEKRRLEQESERFFEENCELQARIDDKDAEIETLKDKQAPLQFTVPLTADKSVEDAIAVAKLPFEKELMAKEREISVAQRKGKEAETKIEKLEANLNDYANRMAVLEATTVRNLRTEVKDLKKMLAEVGIDQ